MAQIPTYEQWMKDTYSLTSPRSEFLKKLDAAIKDYNLAQSPANLDAVKAALDRWRFEQSKQGKDWRSSVRNQKGAVTNLYRAVNNLDKRKLSDAELEALKYISRMQALALQKQFLGKQLAFKSTTLAGMANGAGSKWQKFKTGASSLASGAYNVGRIKNRVQDIAQGSELLHQGGKAAASQAASSDLKNHIVNFCKDLCPGLDPNHVFAALHLGGVDAFAANLAPFLGMISSGGKAIIGWIKVARTAWSKYQVADCRFAFAPEDPEAAFDALLILLNRELTSQTGKAGVHTVAFTGKLLGSFADGGAVTGPALGLVETLAGIFQTIVEYVRDYKESKLANELLRVGALNLDLFNVCPILGCYFLVIQDHSTIINFAVGDYGTPNFVFDVQRLIKKIEPALDKAREFINDSRLEIAGMEKAKGIAAENWSVKGKAGKVVSLKEHIQDAISAKIDGWIEKPEKPPKVDKSRIVGFGSTP